MDPSGGNAKNGSALTHGIGKSRAPEPRAFFGPPCSGIVYARAVATHRASGAATALAPAVAGVRGRKKALAAGVFGMAAVALPAAVYLGTLLPGVGHSGDSAELSTCARLLAVPHPTGYPLYVLTVHALGRLLPVSPALAANLFSALCAVLALLVTWRLLALLGVGKLAALPAVWTLAASPTFWEHAIVAEVYALHALLLALAALLFLRWQERRREADFYGACFVYALAFGNHLLMVTLLPAIVVLVLWVKPRAFVEPLRVLVVVAIIALCATQYGLLVARAADGAAPYRAEPINGSGDLLPFVTGAQFHDRMFGFTAGEFWKEHLPRHVESSIYELAPLAFFVPLGVIALGRTPANAFLVLAFVGNLVFALGYDISDLQPYFIPNYLIGAFFLGAGLEALLRRLEAGSSRAARAYAILALAAPLALGAIRLPRVVAASGRAAAAHAQAILADLGPGTIVIAEYHDYQFLQYYRLVEGRAPAGPHIADESVELGEVLAYLRDGKPLELRQLGLSLPPGLELYSEKLFAPRRHARAGLTIEPWRHDLYRITYSKSEPR